MPAALEGSRGGRGNRGLGECSALCWRTVQCRSPKLAGRGRGQSCADTCPAIFWSKHIKRLSVRSREAVARGPRGHQATPGKAASHEPSPWRLSARHCPRPCPGNRCPGPSPHHRALRCSGSVSNAVLAQKSRGGWSCRHALGRRCRQFRGFPAHVSGPADQETVGPEKGVLI